MAFQIAHLDNVKLKTQLYLFDANLWIKILRPPFNPSGRDAKYLKFFEKFRNDDANPKIALTSLILSEVINRLMREYAMSKYLKENGIDRNSISKGFYKETYRKSEHFKQHYESLCDDIKAFHNLYTLINDGLGKEIMSKHIISCPPTGLDFNDNYYYELAKKKKLAIITDDGDFFVEGVEILTYNEGLYQKYKDTIKPTSRTGTAQ